MAQINPPKRKRSNRLTIRMNNEEFTKYAQILSLSNMTANSFCINCLINKPVIQRTVEEITALNYIAKTLSGMGNNLNQIARLANADNHPPTIIAIENLKSEVIKLWQLSRPARVANR